ncbi:MAG: metabolite traffic protein EboE, partial [Chromatiales bacterium]|nr:metabolite traffic protein EboE [Chromatiales bacterium]
YLPDWRDPERLRYSNVLAELMARLMPDDGDAVGSISSVPGAFKARVTEPAHVAQMVDHLLAHVAVLVDLERRTGKRVVLALEPEPCCYLETVAESVAFFTDHLLAPGNLSNLAGRLNASVVQAEAFVRTHLGVCLDLCHAAVEFEDAATCVSAFEDAGIKIHKMQVSAGLRFDDVGAHTEALLEPFVDAVYLHQVVAQHQAGGLQRYVDLDEAFAALPNEPAGTQWRLHFHVPIFLDSMGQFSSTQSFIEEMLALHRRKPLSSHIEVETYTWNVLPERFRNMSVDAAVARELEWARARALPGLGEGLA